CSAQSCAQRLRSTSVLNVCARRLCSTSVLDACARRLCSTSVLDVCAQRLCLHGWCPDEAVTWRSMFSREFSMQIYRAAYLRSPSPSLALAPLARLGSAACMSDSARYQRARRVKAARFVTRALPSTLSLRAAMESSRRLYLGVTTHRHSP